MRLPFFHRDDEPVSATSQQDMRFFLHSKTDASPRQAPAKPALKQHKPATSAPVVAATKAAAPDRKLRVEREPDTVRMQVPQGFSNMESAISFQLAYERGMSNVGNLKLVDDDFDVSRTTVNASGKQSGYNPYESGYLSRKQQSEADKKPTDLRALSKWIEQKRK